MVSEKYGILNMIRTIPLGEIINAIDANLPAGTVILDPSGNSVIFFKYKGTLIERDSLEFNQAMIRSRVKYSITRGSVLAIKLSHEDDLTQYLVPDTIPTQIFNTTKITRPLLDSFSEGRDDYVSLDKDFRIVFIIKENIIPVFLQRFINEGDLIPVLIA
jgi:hypothetical protein